MSVQGQAVHDRMLACWSFAEWATGALHPEASFAIAIAGPATMADPDTLQIKYSLGKFLDKGEDAWAQQPSSECTLAGTAGEDMCGAVVSVKLLNAHRRLHTKLDILCIHIIMRPESSAR